MQKIIMPMWNVGISQKENGSFSHQGINAIDLYGKDTGIEKAFAPVDLKIVKKYGTSNGRANGIIFQSLDKVLFADGTINYMSMLMMHCNNIDHLSVGQKFNQFDYIYSEGTTGYASGNHIHLEISKGQLSSADMNGWNLSGHINTQKAFFLLPKHNVINLQGNSYKRTDVAEENPIKKTSVLKFNHTNGHIYYIAADPVLEKYKINNSQAIYGAEITTVEDKPFYYEKHEKNNKVVLGKRSGYFEKGKVIKGFHRVNADVTIEENSETAKTTSVLQFIHTNGNTYYIAVDPVAEKYNIGNSQARFGAEVTLNENTTFYYIMQQNEGNLVTLAQPSGYFESGKTIKGLWRVKIDTGIKED